MNYGNAFYVLIIYPHHNPVKSEYQTGGRHESYGEIIKSYRVNLGLTQNEVAVDLDVTPGYISNVENGRTAMSLRILMYYAKLMGVTLDELVGNLEPDYKKNSLDNSILAEISKMDVKSREKLLKTLKIWNKKD